MTGVQLTSEETTKLVASAAALHQRRSAYSGAAGSQGLDDSCVVVVFDPAARADAPGRAFSVSTDFESDVDEFGEESSEGVVLNVTPLDGPDAGKVCMRVSVCECGRLFMIACLCLCLCL